MSSRISQWVGLIGIAATIPLVQTVAVAKTASEVGDVATSITVLITNSSGNGSGVLLQHQGNVYTVLTAAHVVKKKINYQITTPDGRQYDVISSSIVSAPGDIDLAVVKFRSTTSYPIAKLGNCNLVKLGTEIYVAGFSKKTLGRTTPVLDFKVGKVSSNSHQPQAHGYSLIYDNPTIPGMSGGPVLNSNGELVAIHGEGDKDYDGIRTGSNLGIPIERFGMVARGMGVNLEGQVQTIVVNTTLRAEDYFASGVQKEKREDYQGAFTDYNRAIQLNPNYAVAYFNRGLLKLTKLDYTKEALQGVLNDINRVIQIDRKFVYIYDLRALVKYKLNDTQGALDDTNRAIQISPDFAPTYNLRGSLKSQLKNHQGALNDINRAIQIDPNYATAYSNRGSVKSSMNDIRGALADFNYAIQLDPNCAEAYISRGVLKKYKLNDLSGSRTDIKEGYRLLLLREAKTKGSIPLF